jgi:hypothetical protein
VYEVICGLDPENNLYVGTPTIEKCFGFRPDQTREKIASKSFKAFAGSSFRLGKLQAIVSDFARGRAKVNFYPFDVFLTILKWQVKEKNEKAIDLVIAGFADSFSDFAYQEFGVQNKKEERQKWLKTRMESKVVRRTLTDAIKDWLERTDASENTRKFLYATITDNINRGIFSRSAKKLKEDWGCANPRDNMTADELRWVAEVEDLAMRLIDNHGFDPIASIKEALERLLIDKVGR